MLRLKSALTLVLAAALFCLAPAARAADAMFTVSGIHVDASGYSASVAQSVALAQGRPKAWQVMYRRMARQQDWAKQPALADTQLQRLVRNFTVTNERRSTTRYTADITYFFNPAAVGKVLRDANVAFAQSTAHRILLIPMNPTYSRSSGWTNAFTAPRLADAIVPFTLPVSDALDAGALAHLSFDTAGWLDISDVALRVHATEAVLALATVETTQHKLLITLKRLGLGEVPSTATVEVPYVQTAYATYPAAADAATAAIAEMWKQKAAVDFSQKGSITVDVHAASLAQLGGIQTALATVPNITSIRVLAMDIGEARLNLAYLGTVDQLHDALNQASLQLSDDEGDWTLHQGPPQQPGPTANAPEKPQAPAKPAAGKPLRPTKT